MCRFRLRMIMLKRENRVRSQPDYGTLVLAGDNSYTGGTTVSEGILQLGNGGKTGSIKGDVLLNKSDHDVGALAFNRSDNYDFAGNIAGEGEVFQLGSGVPAQPQRCQW